MKDGRGGVPVFAIEDHQLVVEGVNNYVLYGTGGSARKSMTGMFSGWDNQEEYNMLKWVRSYNVARPDDKVEFVGIDIQEGARSLDGRFFLQELFYKLKQNEIINHLQKRS